MLVVLICGQEEHILSSPKSHLGDPNQCLSKSGNVFFPNWPKDIQRTDPEEKWYLCLKSVLLATKLL